MNKVMERNALATAEHEVPVFFAAGKNELFGILTQPVRERLGVVVVALGVGSLASSTARNRFLVRLCRELGAAGYHAFRFDYHGAGESTGTVERFRLDEPFTCDLDAAISWLRTQGMRRFILVGWCFGARTALACAPYIQDLRGLVLVSPPVYDEAEPDGDITWMASRVRGSDMLRYGFRPWVIRGLLDPGRRRRYAKFFLAKLRLSAEKVWQGPEAREPSTADASSGFLQPLEHLVARRVPMLFVFGTAERYYHDFQRAMSAFRDQVGKEASSSIRVAALAGRLHHVPSVSLQEATLKVIEDWLHGQTGAARVQAGHPAQSVPRQVEHP